ncbi:class I SAM-dependent methyltransferase [Arthrobacter crusticola]|nr:class I SAM-dependent methyltransferase [Arthrobacter crusticola]
MHFDRRVEVYEKYRPPYPDALWNRLRDLDLLLPGTRALELGAGSGQATVALVDAGLSVTAVEPGPNLAGRLLERLPQVTVLAGTAEEAELPEAGFDLAVAATSVHWLNLEIVLPKLHRALAPGGSFAVWRTAFGNPAVRTPFRERTGQIVGRRRGAPARPGPDELDTAGWVKELTADGLFAEASTDTFAWSIELGADQIHGLFSTFSNWSAGEVEEAAQAVRTLGGYVTEHYVTPLIVLKRVSTP